MDQTMAWKLCGHREKHGSKHSKFGVCCSAGARASTMPPPVRILPPPFWRVSLAWLAGWLAQSLDRQSRSCAGRGARRGWISFLDPRFGAKGAKDNTLFHSDSSWGVFLFLSSHILSSTCRTPTPISNPTINTTAKSGRASQQRWCTWQRALWTWATRQPAHHNPCNAASDSRMPSPTSQVTRRQI